MGVGKSCHTQLVLVSGPSRGGKSRWAEHLLADSTAVTYVATSARRPNDASWQERLKRHRERRPDHWTLVECGGKLSESLEKIPRHTDVLIDALGGFVAWHLELSDEHWLRHCDGLCHRLASMSQTCVVVIEETGWGVVPPTSLGCLFRDRLGALAQQLERHASRSWLVVQGRAIDLHAVSHSVP